MSELCMDVDVALSEVPVNLMPLIDDTDFKTREEAVTYDQAGLDLVWNFVTTAGAMTQTAVTPTTSGTYDWAHQGNGIYSIEIPASGGASINNDTEGFGWFTGYATGILPWRGPVITFRAAGLNNVLIDDAYSATRGLTGTALPNAAADAAGGLPISDAGGLDVDTLDSNVSAVLTDTGTTLDTLIKDIPTTAEFEARTLPSADYFDYTTDEVDMGKIDGNAAAAGRLRQNIASWTSGTAQSGSGESITLAADASAVDDFHNGDLLLIYGGTGAQQARQISDYNGTTKVATVIGAFATELDATSSYLIIPDGTVDAKLDVIDGIVDDIKTAVVTNAAGADVAADIIALKAVADDVLTDTGTTLDTLIKDIPTVAEFNARSLPSADYVVTTDTIAGVTTVGTCTTNSDMRGTDSAALASVCTEARLAELDAANLPADVDAILTDTGTTLDTLIKDIPTVAEFNARTKPTADYFDHTTDEVDVGKVNGETLTGDGTSLNKFNVT